MVVRASLVIGRGGSADDDEWSPSPCEYVCSGMSLDVDGGEALLSGLAMRKPPNERERLKSLSIAARKIVVPLVPYGVASEPFLHPYHNLLHFELQGRSWDVAGLRMIGQESGARWLLCVGG